MMSRILAVVLVCCIAGLVACSDGQESDAAPQTVDEWMVIGTSLGSQDDHAVVDIDYVAPGGSRGRWSRIIIDTDIPLHGAWWDCWAAVRVGDALPECARVGVIDVVEAE